MKGQMLEEFIRYAKEQFGCDIIAKESSAPDTFKGIFGVSFLEQDEDFFMYEGKSIMLEYANDGIEVSVDLNIIPDDHGSLQEIGVAA